MKNTFTLLVFLGGLFSAAHAQTVELIKDINQSNSFADGIPVNRDIDFVNYDGKIFFPADDDVSGDELWVTDGTAAGTMMVKDINPGPDGSECQKFYVAGSYLFFVADDGEHGQELWRTDGTEAGTVMVKDINPGAADGAWIGTFQPRNDYYVWDDLLYFAAVSDDTFGELWRSDGTEEGTVMIKDINIGTFPDGSPRFFVEHNGQLYFSASFDLWRSDGTEAGTAMVSELSPEYIISCGDYLLFASSGSGLDVELWRSDGTEAGTQLVKEINPNSSNGSSIVCGFPQDVMLTCLDDIAYLIAKDGSGGGRELWRSDGTEAGTFMVKDASSDEFNNCTNNYTDMDGVLFYSFNDGEHGHELWRSDGTEAGTYLVKDLLEGTSGAMEKVEAKHIFAVEDRLLFAAGTTSPSSLGLWWSDGTTEGTELIDGWNGASDADPQHFTYLGGDEVIFTAEGSSGGFELYKLSLEVVETNSNEALSGGLQVELAPTLVDEGHFRLFGHSNTMSNFDIALIDLTGRTVKRWEGIGLGETLGVQGVATGTYFVRVSNADGAFTTKKVVIKN